MTLTDDQPITGFTFGGRLTGWMTDPIIQAVALTAAVSLIFLILPGIDIWFTSLFTPGNRGGFPMGNLEFFRFLRDINRHLSWIVPVVLIVVLVAKLVRPDRLTLVPPAKILFVLGTGLIGPLIAANAIFKANWGRPRPNDVILFGQGGQPFVPPWVITDYCPANCSFISGEGASAFWLLSLAVLVPKEWRPFAVKALFAFCVAVSLNRVAFGGHYLSDVLIAWGITALIMLVAYRYIFERPLRWFENARLEADLTRLGVWIRKRLGFPTPALETPTLDLTAEPVRPAPPPAPPRAALEPPPPLAAEREATDEAGPDGPPRPGDADADAEPPAPSGEEPPATPRP